MRLHAQIHVADVDAELLRKCFVAEEEAMQTKRTRVSISSNQAQIEFNVESADPVALRATLHGITKLLTVYEKGKK
jgi:tRNA threonylcarbamoyladenosine modification (KEOPS) complex  Pcc1 subunit